ncbi:hypothetical protein NFI96_012793 [Prochilodus magdalenae]|nr:hypothetical protein NFI96_012793 [Prochilodus magdalenae]
MMVIQLLTSKQKEKEGYSNELSPTSRIHIPSGKGHSAIARALGVRRTTVRVLIHTQRRPGTVENQELTKMTCRLILEEPRPASFASVYVAKAPLLTKQNTGSSHIRQQTPRGPLRDFWDNIPKLELSGRHGSHSIWPKANPASHHGNIIPAAKRGGGYALSLSGYHLCSELDSVPVTSVVSSQTPSSQLRPCGGWLPWKMCNVTIYTTTYTTQLSYVQQEVKRCCQGFEQVGSYCALTLNRSAEFTAKPGVCPARPGAGVGSKPGSGPGPCFQCEWDTDCPGWQKCCRAENTSCCVEPQTQGVYMEGRMKNFLAHMHTNTKTSARLRSMVEVVSWSECLVITEGTKGGSEHLTGGLNTRWWFNLTVTVKAAFHLVNTSSGLFNHTRLLHSVVRIHTRLVHIPHISAVQRNHVTGALSFPSVSVYHVTSWPAGSVSTASTLLLGSSDNVSHAETSTRLQLLLENIEEITAVDVSDVDECVTTVLRDCAHQATCTNTHGSYTCTCPPGYTDLYPSRPGTNCMGFHTNIILSIGPLHTKPAQQTSTSALPPTADPPQAAAQEHLLSAGNQTLRAVTRLTNINFTNALLNPNSEEYRTLTNSIINEDPDRTTTEQTLHSLPPDILELVHSGKVVVQITGLSPGSVVVNFTLIFLPNSTQDILGVTVALMSSLQNSSQYTMDSALIEDVDECSLREADCSPWADCVNTFGSYGCTCRSGYTDANPSRPGRTCQGTAAPHLQREISRDNDTHWSSYRYNQSHACTKQHQYDLHHLNIIHSFTYRNINNINIYSAIYSAIYTVIYSTIFSAIYSVIYTIIYSTIFSAIYSVIYTIIYSTIFSAIYNVIYTIIYTIIYSIIYSVIYSVIYNVIYTIIYSIIYSVIYSVIYTIIYTIIYSTIFSAIYNVIYSVIYTIIYSVIYIISQTEAISVDCRPGSIAVSVARDFLSLKRISEASLYLGQPQCAPTNGTTSHVQLIVAWDKCGVQIYRNNNQNSTVQVTLYSNMTSWVLPGIAPIARLEVPIICTYNNKILISTGYESSSYLDTIDDAVQGSGTFHVTVRLLNGTTPLPQNYTLTPMDEVIIEVAVNSSVSQIKVIINKCWANPSSNPSDLPQFIFLEESCPVPRTYTTVIQNGNSTRSLLAVNVFSLVNLDVIYLHCQIQICIELPPATCRPSCVARSSRSSNVIAFTKASCGPLLRPRPVTPGEAVQGTRTIGFILLGVGLFVLLLVGMAALSYYRKRMGNYNFRFKPRMENFTYHVFDK